MSKPAHHDEGHTMAQTIHRTRLTIDALPQGVSLDKIGYYSNEYGKRGIVWRDPGTALVYVQINVDPTYFYPVFQFANLDSFEAYKREVDYVDREHRLPGVNPHAQPWII
jgi:hypothetical protein